MFYEPATNKNMIYVVVSIKKKKIKPSKDEILPTGRGGKFYAKCL